MTRNREGNRGRDRSIRALGPWILRLGAAGLLALFAWGAAFPNRAGDSPPSLEPTAEATPTVVAATPAVAATATPVPEPTLTPLVDVLVPPRPGGIGPDERWIDVNLGAQAASAMIGDRRVYLAYVTTGKPGWETPQGIFTIWRRVADETMTSASLGLDPGEEYYVLDNVLYTQYFDADGDALHLNYWQPDEIFGREPRSHGCVGMRLGDAAYFWEFADIGTRVVIHA